MQNRYGIIVVYNKCVDDSITYDCLKKIENVNIIVCDNSTRDYDNKEKVERDGYIYINMNGNSGLSKAYNKAIDKIQSIDTEMQGYIMLFDDDTFIPTAYFEAVDCAIKSDEADIYLPIVEDEVGILSPSIMKKYYCHRAPADVWSIKEKELCGINSGMVIRLALFSDYRYNEGIFLDYVDHNFLRDMRTYHRKVKIMDVKIKQTFSSNTDPKDKAFIRFKIFKKDINKFYEHGFGNRFFFHYVILRRKLQLTRKYRDVRILFM